MSKLARTLLNNMLGFGLKAMTKGMLGFGLKAMGNH
jgi:hypothetical protein